MSVCQVVFPSKEPGNCQSLGYRGRSAPIIPSSNQKGYQILPILSCQLLGHTTHTLKINTLNQSSFTILCLSLGPEVYLCSSVKFVTQEVSIFSKCSVCLFLLSLFSCFYRSIHSLWVCMLSRSIVSNSYDLKDCSLSGFSVHEIFQARILEWVTISSSRGSSWPRDRTQVSCFAGSLLHWQAGSLPLNYLGSPQIFTKCCISQNSQQNIYRYTERNILSEIAHAIIEAEKSYDLLSVN